MILESLEGQQLRPAKPKTLAILLVSQHFTPGVDIHQMRRRFWGFSSLHTVLDAWKPPFFFQKGPFSCRSHLFESKILFRHVDVFEYVVPKPQLASPVSNIVEWWEAVGPVLWVPYRRHLRCRILMDVYGSSRAARLWHTIDSGPSKLD